MSFADAAQRHREADGSLRQSRLIGVEDDARVEQSGRFEGIFFAEIGADQQRPVAVDGIAIDRQAVDLSEAAEQQLFDVPVALGERGGDALQLPAKRLIVEREDALDDSLRPRVILVRERPEGLRR